MVDQTKRIATKQIETKQFTYTVCEQANAKGTVLRTIDYGAAMLDWEVALKDGSKRDILLGFANLDDLLHNSFCFGATVGRSANRIGGGWYHNPTEDAPRGRRDASEDDVREAVQLTQNEGANHLHGGREGFQYKLWNTEVLEDESGVRYTYFSEDGEEGYPGNLQVSVTYRLDDDDRVTIDFEANTDETTIVNLTNHAYFNLDGSDTILGHEAKFESSQVAVVDEYNVPTGELEDVAHTSWDFQEWREIGEAMQKEPEALKMGYDSHFVVEEAAPFSMRTHAKLRTDELELTMSSDLPGFQCYSAGYLNDKVMGKTGAYQQFGGICLEAQFCPNAVNIASDDAAFVRPFLTPEETYRHTIEYRVMKR